MNDNKEDVYFGEVQYFFQAHLQDNQMITLVLASVYRPPNRQTLTNSSNALWTCEYFGHEAFQVFPVTWIKSCVVMPPLKKPADEWFYLCEKMGLAVAYKGGIIENVKGNEGNDDLDDMYL